MKVFRLRDSEDHITPEAVAGSAASMVEAGSVLVVTRSGILEHTFPVALTDRDVTVNQDLKAFTPNRGVRADYAAWALRRYGGEILKACKKDGTTVASVEFAMLRAFELPIAPIREQERIVDAIDEQLSRLDAAASSLNRVQAKLNAYRASVLHAALEGRLVLTEAEAARREDREYVPASALLKEILGERRKRWEKTELSRLKKAGKPPKDDTWKARYREPEAADTSALPELPEGWCWVTVEQLAADEPNSLCDGPFGSNLKTEHYTSEGPRVVRLQNIGDGEFVDAQAHVAVSHFEKLRRHEVFAGDLVVASLGEDVPRAARVPPSLGQAIVKADCLRFSVDPKLADAGFVMHALNSPPTRKRVGDLVHGIGRPRIGLTLFRQTAVPLPPRAEQERLAEEIDRHISVAVEGASDVERDSLRLRRLRQSILKWAFEGKLVDQDPNDEPAENLLARVRAERAAPPSPKSSRGRKAKK
jgi:type I restriction enzyme S subunit